MMRRLIRLVFAVAALSLPPAGAPAQRPTPNAAPQLNFLTFGDWGSGLPDQQTVSAAMAAAAAKQQPPFDAVLSLGDNFYVTLPDGAKSKAFRSLFEEMYSKEKLPFPFYIALGNHDVTSEKKLQAELDYAKQNPDSRWKLPSRWYRRDLPEGKPLVSLLVLDSNRSQLGKKFDDEMNWLEAELARPRPGKWLVCMAHHPLFNNGKHKDDKFLIDTWGPLFTKYKVDLYLAGHDHNLQHLEIPGYPTSFCVSGGGGQLTYALLRDDRGPFAARTYGYTTLHFTLETATIAFFNSDGKKLHEFERKPNAVETTPVREPVGAGK